MIKHVLLAISYNYPDIHRGVARFAAEHKWHLNAGMIDSGQLPENWHGDGAIVQGATSEAYQRYVKKLKVPVVSIGEYDWGFPEVSDDHEKIGQMAAEYYLAKGYKSFAVYHENSLFEPRPLRYFREFLEQYDYPCANLILPKSTNNWGDASAELVQMIAKLDKPVAVFCNRDLAATEVLDCCLEHGIKVPEEVAVLGKHNEKMICEALATPLSSVDNNLELMGYLAARQLHRLLNGESIEKNIKVPVRGIVSRQSTDFLATVHPGLRLVVEYLQENFRKTITGVEIAKVCGLSPRGLQHAFKKEYHQTVSEWLTARRLECACRLLQTTDKKLDLIAAESGLKSVVNFHAHFKKKYGITPAQYRTQQRLY